MLVARHRQSSRQQVQKHAFVNAGEIMIASSVSFVNIEEPWQET